MFLFSAGLYEEFAMTIDEKISRIANYNLFHMHATSMLLLDYIIGMKGIQIIQVSKEEESFKVENIIGDLLKIQASGKCLILKGRFTTDDFEVINKRLDRRGLCIQPVIKNVNEANDVIEIIDSAS